MKIVITHPIYNSPQTICSLLFVCILILLPNSPGFAANGSNTETLPPTLDQRYNQAKFYFNQLETNTQLSQQRENWIKGTQNFRRIYLTSPKSEHAPACLFMLGKMYHRMFAKFHQSVDLDESISYYKDTARLFSEHRLADDSYYTVGLIYLNDRKDPKNASKYLSKVVSDYPTGDMHPRAADTLKQLSRDYDIPLPKVMVGNSQLDKLSYVLPVKYWSSNDYTRVVIMASGPVNYKDELLEKTKDQPRRLYIDFQNSYIEPQFRSPVPIEDGLLKAIRTGQFSKDTVRVVLDIETLDSYKIYSLPDPFRVVIDVRGQPRSQDQQRLSKPSPQKPAEQLTATIEPIKPVILRNQKKYVVRRPSPASTTEEIEIPSNNHSFSLAQQLGLGVKRIVLDPGHGGKDPGAIANGLKEKDIVLKIAKQLQPILERDLRCEVILTRNDDTFISLEERTAIANTQNADLFVSLHINAHPSPRVRGLETYFLNLSTNAEAMRVAARENATSTHQMSDLQDILSDIMKNSKINESSRLARHVHQSLLAGLSEREFGPIKNLGVKQAPFYVLIGAEMPAILIEIAFISNQADAKNLTTPQFLSALAKEISQGIKTYVNTNTASL